MLRSIPNTTYVELFASEDANQLRETLKDKIDEVLRDIGNYEYEEDEYENGFSESEEINNDIESGGENILPPEKIRPSEWVEKNLKFCDGELQGSPMRLYEFQKQPLDSIIEPGYAR